ncbi:hypothetical protein GCM10025866_32320 [Naasia aerilata]|uniref:QcrA subunit N-terminal domain-containing protein n=1 Tax=Naasia aerilata TaxID=1162966 RepID=A0ABM8GG38_9MICO|nr:hypothetical protein GCM10025866_32320 [Naasia aerilata]
MVAPDAIENPGLPPHRERITDLDPKADRRNERGVSLLFYLSLVFSVLAIVAYFAVPIVPDNPDSVRLNTLFLGLAIALALLTIGVATVHWGKALMASHETVEMRHPTRGRESTRARAVEIFDLANKESGFGRRSLLRNSLIAALVAVPLPAIFLFRDLAPKDNDPAAKLSHTMWKKGTRLTRDPSGTPILAADVTLGSVFHVVPEGLTQEEQENYLEEKAKAAVLLMRLKPEDLQVSPVARPGTTTGSSRTPRSAPTSAARWHSMSSRPTTCSAPATSRSSTSPAKRRSSSAPPSVPCPSCRSRWTAKAT